MKFLAAIFAAVILTMLMGGATTATADLTTQSNTYQGKTVKWWAKRAVQARKDANARSKTVHRLKKVLKHDATIEECVKLATIAYPRFTEGRAWQIIGRESGGNPRAKNKHSTASGLMQFLTSTWASTPYAHMSIWNPCTSLMAAGWMHQVGRGGEWAY